MYRWAHFSGKPASLFEILTFGYKAAWRLLGPLTLLTLPFALACGFTEAYYRTWQDFWSGMGVLLMTAVCTLYGFYAVSRYMRDTLMAEPSPGLFSYWLPRVNGFGFAWIGLLHSFVMVVIVVGDMLMITRISNQELLRLFQATGYWSQFWASVVVLALFLLPVATLGSYANVAFGLYLAEYLARPGYNIVAAMMAWLRVLRDASPARLMMLGFIATLLGAILALPAWEIVAIKEAVSDVNPSLAVNPAFFALDLLISALDNWFYMAIGFAGFMAAMFRLNADLQCRQDNIVSIAEVPDDSAATEASLPG